METASRIDDWNEAEDLVRHVIALSSGARTDGSRCIRFRGTDLRCDRRNGQMLWRVGSMIASPIYWHAHFRLQPTAEQRAIVERIAARP